MKTESVFTHLIVTLISTFSYPHDNVGFVDNISNDINQEAKAIQDESKCGKRDFLGYKMSSAI